jgi:lipoyl(octanoyl) transferase
MNDIWRLLITPPSHGAWNMAVDEAVLDSTERAESPPTVRLYSWDPPCLSLGQAQPIADVDMDRLQANGWEIVRRITGGRAILHTDELTYSVAGPALEPRLAGSVLESYNRLALALLEALRALGLPVEIQTDKQESSGVPNPICFEVPSTYELTVHGKKLIGSAQARRKAGVLQHGSLPLGGDLTRICQVLFFPDENARQSASQRLLARATTVTEVQDRVMSWDHAAQAFIGSFEKQLGIKFQRGELTPEELSRTETLVREKYDHPSWTGRV